MAPQKLSVSYHKEQFNPEENSHRRTEQEWACLELSYDDSDIPFQTLGVIFQHLSRTTFFSAQQAHKILLALWQAGTRPWLMMVC